MLTIDNFIRNQREAILYSTERQKFGNDPYMAANDKAALAELQGKVSQYAIDKIKIECAKRTKNTKPNANCTCPVRINFNIPCKHQLLDQSVISLSSVPARWHLSEKQSELAQDVTYSNEEEKIDVTKTDLAIKRTVYAFEQALIKLQDDQQRMTIFDQLTKLLNNISSLPALKELNEPIPLKATRGRPKGTKRLPLAIELKEKEIAAHEKAEKKRQRKATEEKKVKKIKLIVHHGSGQDNIDKCDEESDNASVIFDDSASNIPSDLPLSVVINGISVDGLLEKEFVKTVWNVEMDGHCGFRCIAQHIFGDQNEWPSIKLSMKSTLLARHRVYSNSPFLYNTKELLNILSFMMDICPSQYWFTTPDCAQIAADAFATPIAIYTGTGRFAQLFLPVGIDVPEVLPKPIIMQLVNGNHFVLIELHDDIADFKLPSLNAQHKIACSLLELDDHWTSRFNA
ncbi:hypothetical protein BJV82DRAFT_582471 [Fennellomyces sp. T-0311]|nr:hypothetical protein BJV82DRAFT_582471 [Fennellomyces sp. T-0311]